MIPSPSGSLARTVATRVLGPASSETNVRYLQRKFSLTSARAGRSIQAAEAKIVNGVKSISSLIRLIEVTSACQREPTCPPSWPHHRQMITSAGMLESLNKWRLHRGPFHQRGLLKCQQWFAPSETAGREMPNETDTRRWCRDRGWWWTVEATEQEERGDWGGGGMTKNKVATTGKRKSGTERGGC